VARPRKHPGSPWPDPGRLGRARQQTHQVRGHHIFLYPKGHPIYQGHLKPFTAEDIEALRNKVAEILTEDKYHKMAALAGVE
jgi:hypothetical protein